MRLFAGIPVPEPARGELAQVLAGLAARDWPVRWVRAEGLHLTIKFFGTVEPGAVPPLESVLQSAAATTGPIPLATTGLGSFPPGSRARVIWVGLDAPAALELLQDTVERACEPLGFPVEGRPFRPHITLGRVRENARLGPNAVAAVETGDIAFLAEHLVLFESRPGPGGARYEPLQRFPLVPCAAA